MDTQRIEKIEARQDDHEKTNREILGKLTDILSELKVGNAQHAEMVRRVDKHDDRLEKLEDRTTKIENTQSEYKPMIDLMKSINGRIWFLLLGGLATMAAIVYSTMG